MKDKATYIESRLAEYGLTPEAPINSFEWQDLDLDGQKRNCPYFQAHEDGMEIHSPNVYGGREFHFIRKKKNFISRLRLEHPTKDENGKVTKYKFTSSFKKDHKDDIKGSWFFLPPRIYDLIKKKEKIRTLWITEGELKSFIPSMWGLDIAGIPGISNFREYGKGPLLDALKYIILTCKVENVVIFYDSDCLDLSSRLGKNNAGADARPRMFYKSAAQLRKLFLQENVNVFLGYIKPQEKKLGLDDLFKVTDAESKKSFDTRCYRLIDQLKRAFDKVSTQQVNNDDLFSIFDITEQNAYDPETKKSYRILPRIFKIDTVQRFYDYHKTNQLKDFESFRFKRLLHDVIDGTPVIHDDQTKFHNPTKRIGNAYFITDKEGWPTQFSDFAIDLHYIIYINADDTRRIATFTNTFNETYFTELKKDVLTSVMKFKEKLNSWNRFNFFGSSKQLDYVKALIEYQTDVISAKMVTRLGWQEDEGVWSFSNGIIKEGQFIKPNSHGIASVDGKGYFLPTFSKIKSFSEQYKNDRWFMHYDSPESKQIPFSEFRDKMYQYFKSKDENGLIGVLYLIMALFSDIVFDNLKFAPLLYLTGIHSSGKNTMARSIMAPFGRYQQPPNIHSISATAANRICSHFQNSIVWIDEWKNEIPKWKQEYVKSSFDRTGRTIAKFTNDDAVKRVEYKSVLMLSGQDIPGQGAADPAITSRGIICFFRNNKFSAKEKANVKEFETLQDKYGMTHLLRPLLEHRKQVEEGFSTKYTDLQSKLAAIFLKRGKEVSGRIMDIHIAMATPGLLLQEAGLLDLAMTEEDILEVIYQKSIVHHQLAESENEVSGFWQIFETLYYMNDERHNDDLRDGYEFRIQDNILGIQLNRVYDRYARYARKNSKVCLDKNTLGEYLKNHPSYRGTKSMRFKDGLIGKPMTFERGLLKEAQNIITEKELEIRKAQSEQPVEKEAAKPEVFAAAVPPIA